MAAASRPTSDGAAESGGQLVARLARRRAASGLSQADVARSIQTSQPAVARLESGQTDVRLSTLSRYAQALNVSLDFVEEADGPGDAAPPAQYTSPAARPDDLTWRQQRVLTVIRDSVDRRGYPPSMREIAEAVGLASTSSVSYQLSTLQSKGYLHRDPARPRTVEIQAPAGPARPPDEETGAPAERRGPERSPVDIPFMGSIAAGRFVLAGAGADDAIRLPARLTGGGALFAVTVTGETLPGAPVADGDVVVARRQQEAEDGDIVVAMFDGETTIRTLQRCNGQLWLMPHDAAHLPVLAGQAAIAGRAVAIVRKI